MSMQQKARVSVIGAAQVGKKTFVEGHMCKYFKGQSVATEPPEYVMHVSTNKGPIELTMFCINSVKDVSVKGCDGHIIMSDVTDENMHTLFKKRYIELIDCLGLNNRTPIVNFFNKTDITNQPTYIFDSSVPSFDVSSKTTSGINEALTIFLRRVLDEPNLLICM